MTYNFVTIVLLILYMSNRHTDKDVFDDFMKNKFQPIGLVNVFGMMDRIFDRD